MAEAGQQVRDYVVSISTENDNPYIFGPYTQRKASELSRLFNEQIEQGVFNDEGWIYSTAQRIQNPQTVNQMLREFGKEIVHVERVS